MKRALRGAVAWATCMAALAASAQQEEPLGDGEAAVTQWSEIREAAILRASSRDGGALRKALLRREVGVAALQEAVAALPPPDVNARGDDGHTPLTVEPFVLATAAERARLLLRAGAQVDGTDARGNTPLYYALRRGDVALTATLLRAGAKIDRVALGKFSAMQVAICYGRIDEVPLLAAAGASVGDTVDGWSVEHAAARLGKLAALRELPLDQERIDVRGPSGVTPLIVAAKWGRVHLVLGALQAGATVDLADDAGRTALMWAAQQGYVDAVKALLDAGADPNRTTKTGENAYLLAGRRGEETVQRILVARGVAAQPVQLADEVQRALALAPDRRRALALAALDLHVAGFSLGALSADAAENARAKDWLKKAGIDGHHAVRMECRKLRDTEVGETARAMSAEETRAKEDELLTDPVALAAWRARQRATPAAALAARLSRHNFLVVLGARAGWLGEAEAWLLLERAERELAAARVSWADVGAGAIARLEKARGGARARLAAMEKLLRDEDSPTALWRLSPWR